MFHRLIHTPQLFIQYYTTRRGSGTLKNPFTFQLADLRNTLAGSEADTDAGSDGGHEV